MNAHLSSILLGVRDMNRTKRFYTDLGWKVGYVWSIGYSGHGKDQPYAE